MASVSISQVKKTYGNVGVLHGISANIDDGEFVILVGPSGCGKSTLLRMIAGLETITSGTIKIGDRVVNNTAPKDRDIAMVFQSYALYPHMTVAQNMGLALKLKKVDKKVAAEQVASAAAILGLTRLLDRYPKQLSGGQRQRVAMGRAIVRDPKVFLFDEPLSNLDAKLRVAMRTEIKGLHHRLNATMIYVTHDQIEAMTMADRIVVMHDGIIEQVGRPIDLYDRPANLFVAGFIGSPAMNLLPGTVTGAQFTSKSGLQFTLGRALPAGSEVVLGIRPENFILDDKGIELIVESVEPTGAETHIVANGNGDEVIVVLRQRYISDPGAGIRVLPDVESIHLFDAKNGTRIE